MKYIKNILFLSLVIIIFSGCSLLEDFMDDASTEKSSDPQSNIESIDELKHTDYFSKHALAHIFEGELNNRNQAVGFHYDGLPTKKGKVIENTETKPDEHGVYEAKVEIEGIKKQSNQGKSSFFPKEKDAQEVVEAINEAYEHKTHIRGNTYEGLTSDGIVIHMYLNQQDKIISAFPIY